MNSCSSSSSSSNLPTTITHLSKLINEHPFPSLPLQPLLLHHLLPLLNSKSSVLILSSLFSHLFSSHSLPHKSLELLRFSIVHSPSSLSPSILSLLITSLSRLPLFPSSAFLLLDISRRFNPSLLSPSALSSLLSPLALHSPHPFPSSLSAFSQAQLLWPAPFAAAELNSLLRAFCAARLLPLARAAFQLLHRRIPPDSHCLNTLLHGFRISGDLPALHIFYNNLLLRGFRPDAASFNIRIHAYCRAGLLPQALRLLPHMDTLGIPPNVKTITTLIHGARIAGQPSLARHLFDQMPHRGISPDRASYNALIGAFVKSGDSMAGVDLLDEMNMKGIEPDDVTYYTILSGYNNKTSSNIHGFLKIYDRMIGDGIAPRMRTVMMLMKFFREHERWDLAMELWEYLLEKGRCPPRHALDIMVRGLCFRGQVIEAYECFEQMLRRGRFPSEEGVQFLEEFLIKSSDEKRLNELREMISSLKKLLHCAS